VKRLPEVKDYTQALVFDRSHTRGKPATYEDLPINGIVELWFTDEDSLNAGFVSDAGKTLMTHATEFIAEISTFLWSKRTKSFELLPGRQCRGQKKGIENVCASCIRMRCPGDWIRRIGHERRDQRSRARSQGSGH